MKPAILLVLLTISCCYASIINLNVKSYFAKNSFSPSFQPQTIPSSVDPCASSHTCAANSDCGWGSVCDKTSLTCVYSSTTLGCNAACNYNSLIGAGNCPDGQTCNAPINATCFRSPGSRYVDCPCTTTGTCALPATCQNGFCSLTNSGSIPSSLACVNNADCASNSCVSSVCVGKTAGTGCTKPGECAVGLVCGTTTTSTNLRVCSAKIAVGGACLTTDNAVPCIGSSYCDPTSLKCTAAFTVDVGGSCAIPNSFYPLTCKIGTYPGYTLNGDCKCYSSPNSTTCSQFLGASNCGVGFIGGFSCSCSGTTQQCVGSLPQTCLSKLAAMLDCIDAYPTADTDLISSAIADNYVPLSSSCYNQASSFLCDSSCAKLFPNTDGNTFSCITKKPIPYTKGIIRCAETYCAIAVPSSAHSISVAVSVLLLAVFSPFITRTLF